MFLTFKLSSFPSHVKQMSEVQGKEMTQAYVVVYYFERGISWRRGGWEELNSPLSLALP
jgi:hypothetical protein